MKKAIAILLTVLLCAALVASLAACGDDKTATEAQTETTAPTTAENAPAATEAGANSDASGITAEDTVFTYNGVNVVLNEEAEAIIAALGEPTNVSSQTSCHGGEGDDKTYEFAGFTVGTYPKDGVDRILEVVISEAAIPTNKGVQVGDAVSKVTETYGEGFRTVGKYYYYETEDGDV